MMLLFDTNIIIDIILTREPFFNDSSKVFEFIDGEKFKGCITASSLTDIYYIVKKKSDHATAINFIESLILTVEILNVNKDTIILALHANFKDFEDAVQNAAAELNHIDLIISRNTQDFTDSKIPVQTPTDFLKQHN
ncbi:type II toxin-antitoxin system VapC family toxin [Pedobacter sp. AW1-32]|uniref:type II toxin-antitoxin system VapC family toxin n=1 Tax=Pedobacter sp. AW1-32 TaxID=3383026 RepID=UPI003FEDF377